MSATCIYSCDAKSKCEKWPNRRVWAVFHLLWHCFSCQRRWLTVPKATPIWSWDCKLQNGVRLGGVSHCRLQLGGKVEMWKTAQTTTFWPLFIYWDTAQAANPSGLQHQSLHRFEAYILSFILSAIWEVSATCAWSWEVKSKCEKWPNRTRLGRFSSTVPLLQLPAQVSYSAQTYTILKVA